MALRSGAQREGDVTDKHTTSVEIDWKIWVALILAPWAFGFGAASAWMLTHDAVCVVAEGGE